MHLEPVGSPRKNNVLSPRFDCIWNQWVLLYLTDKDLVTYLKKCADHLGEKGFIFVKENCLVEDRIAIDEEDNGVTRSDKRYQALFKEAGMKICCAVRQTNWPKDLYPIFMYVLTKR